MDKITDLIRLDFNYKFNVTDIDQEMEIARKNELIEELTLQNIEDKKNSIYNFLVNINREYILFYFVFGLIIFVIFNNINYTSKNIIALIATLIILYIINDRNEVLHTGLLKDLELKYESIYPPTNYLQNDAGLIELIYSIKKFRYLSDSKFDKIVLEIDSFLEIEEILYGEKLKNMHGLYKILKHKRKLILNYFHSFIYNIDPEYTDVIEKLNTTLKSLHEIINLHLLNITDFINFTVDNSPTTVYSRKIYFSDKEQAFDPDTDYHFDFFV